MEFDKKLDGVPEMAVAYSTGFTGESACLLGEVKKAIGGMKYFE